MMHLQMTDGIRGVFKNDREGKEGRMKPWQMPVDYIVSLLKHMKAYA